MGTGRFLSDPMWGKSVRMQPEERRKCWPPASLTESEVGTAIFSLGPETQQLRAADRPPAPSGWLSRGLLPISL